MAVSALASVLENVRESVEQTVVSQSSVFMLDSLFSSIFGLPFPILILVISHGLTVH